MPSYFCEHSCKSAVGRIDRIISVTGTVTPTNSGPVTVGMNAGNGADLVGNPIQASVSVTTEFDGTHPAVTISGNPEATAGPFPVSITFSEPVIGFEDADVTVGNGGFVRTGSSFTPMSGGVIGLGGVVGTITPIADGPVPVSVAEGVATDAIGNSNSASTSAVTTIANLTAPTVTIAAFSGASNAAQTAIIILSEACMDFTLEDLVMSSPT